MARNKLSMSCIDLGADYTEEEVVWLRAVSTYKAKTRKLTLSPAEILALAHSLGYRKPKKKKKR